MYYYWITSTTNKKAINTLYTCVIPALYLLNFNIYINNLTIKQGRKGIISIKKYIKNTIRRKLNKKNIFFWKKTTFYTLKLLNLLNIKYLNKFPYRSYTLLLLFI